MLPKKIHPEIKAGLHPRNKHRERYDFKLLIDGCLPLGQYVKLNKYNDLSIDFFNPQAVKMLNRALLKHYYNISWWELPEGYLCPPIPGRADYIHHMADLLENTRAMGEKIPDGGSIKCLDIGVGANCIYPIIGNKEYGWTFTGTDTDPIAVAWARKIIEKNPSLQGKIEIKLQENPKDIFRGVIQKDQHYDLSICNPPFHSSSKEAQSGSLRKLKNLKNTINPATVLNFGGHDHELWCEGGEEKFVSDMIYQSRHFASNCFWFSSLVSKQSNLKSVYNALKKAEAAEVKTIPMSHGNKKSRIVAWTFYK